MKKILYISIALLGLGVWALSQKKEIPFINLNSNSMEITSSAFTDRGFIPAKYTCDGENINPPLDFSMVPQEAKSLVLIVDDPDAPAGTWVHWVVWNIDPQKTNLKENETPAGAQQGTTSFDKNEYGGPCPPSGIHRYFFKLYALDTVLNIPTSTGKEGLTKEIEKHTLAKAELIGLYTRE